MVLYPHHGDGKIFLENALKRGTKLQTIWDDIAKVGTSKERTGYPTQKPLALLDRIIKASSNEGDVVLDPFCGCATACVAAERLGRQWIGIDISPSAETITKLRLINEAETKAGRGTGVLKENQLPLPFDPLTDMSYRFTTEPLRTDRQRRMNHRHTDAFTQTTKRSQTRPLFGKQEGKCNGCQ